MTKALETENPPHMDKYVSFLKLNDWKRFEEIRNILDFYIAGETNNKLLLFFLLLGNYHKKLKSFVLVRGDSSAGKNHIVKSVLKLLPEDDVYTYDSATAQALNYDDELDEVEIIYLRELEYHQSTVEMLKSLYNEDGKVHKETIRDKRTGGHSVKKHILERKGIVTTFSFENIQVDVVNRGWALVPDQSYDQTDKIVKFGIEEEKYLIERELKRKEMKDKCFFISQCINHIKRKFNEYEVFIPYVEKLEVLLPTTQLNVRRDKNKLFNLIKIITLWNLYNRKSFSVGNKKYLLAEYTDLRMALKMCEKLFINLVLHLDDTKKAILDYMEAVEVVPIKEKNGQEQRVITSKYGEEVSTKEKVRYYSITEVHEDLREQLSISRSTVKRKLDDLFYESYLLRKKPGGTFLYSKLRDYNLINILKLPEIKNEIDAIVKQKYVQYSNITIGDEVIDEDDF